MVLGHQRCGAVAATLDALHDGALPQNSVAAVIRTILPVARTVPPGPDQLDELIRANARAVVATLRMSPVLRSAIETGKLRVAAAYYSLDAGTVTLF
jgi:carbonic anhydrase